MAAALIAGALVVRPAWTQSTTTTFATAYVVTTCGTPPTMNTAGNGFSYTADHQAPLTMNTGGALCVNQ
jgi:hypothetical protein